MRNNWYPGQVIGEAEKRYQTRSINLLEARAKQAMFEYNPYRINQLDPEQVYRGFQFGPLLDVFMLDERSYRGANSPNTQTRLDADSAFLGSQQTAWLKASLKASRATWKVIASDMPISLVVPDANPDVPKGTFEAWANADNGAPSGRELELADILRFIKQEDIRNVVWITADVHYAQATHYDPSRAKFTEFAVLGIRRRADQRGHVRPERSRHDVRSRTALCQRAEGQSAEPFARGHAAVLWPREDRSREPRADGLAARPQRQVAVRSEARRRGVSVA